MQTTATITSSSLPYWGCRSFTIFSTYTVEKANLNCRASVNFLLPCQEGQPKWGGKIVIHAIGGTFSWWNWQYKFSISIKNFSHCLKLSQWKISRSNRERFGERWIGCNSLTSEMTFKNLWWIKFISYAYSAGMLWKR